MQKYNSELQQQVLSSVKEASTYTAWNNAYNKAIALKYPRGRVFQRLVDLEINNALKSHFNILGTTTGRFSSLLVNTLNQSNPI
jgi:hypothetical protein